MMTGPWDLYRWCKLLGAKTVCSLTRNIVLSTEQLLKTDTIYSLQAVMAVSDVFLDPEPRGRVSSTPDGTEW